MRNSGVFSAENSAAIRRLAVRLAHAWKFRINQYVVWLQCRALVQSQLYLYIVRLSGWS